MLRIPVRLLLTAGVALSWMPDSGRAQESPYTDALLTKVRAAARFVPGDLPSELRYPRLMDS
jgi:hypothetical protein